MKSLSFEFEKDECIGSKTADDKLAKHDADRDDEAVQ